MRDIYVMRECEAVWVTDQCDAASHNHNQNGVLKGRVSGDVVNLGAYVVPPLACFTLVYSVPTSTPAHSHTVLTSPFSVFIYSPIPASVSALQTLFHAQDCKLEGTYLV